MTRRSLAVSGLAAIIVACGKQTVPEAGSPPASSAGTPAAYAVFAEHEVVLDRLEAPVPLAMTAGSSANLVSSSAPEIVSVQSGALVPHRNGRAEIHSPSDPRPLVVLVRAVRALRIEPDALTLRPGEVRPFRILADGAVLPDNAVTWSFSDPEVAVAEGSRARAGYKPGKAQVIAAYGGLQSSLSVEVRNASAPFRVIARNRFIQRGGVEQLTAEVPAGAQLLWSSSDERVLKPLRGGLFQAQARGTAKACAHAEGRETCVALEVR